MLDNKAIHQHRDGQNRRPHAQIELQRQQWNDRMETLFWEWAKNKGRICSCRLSNKEKRARLRQIPGPTGCPAREARRGGLSPEALREIEQAARILS